MSTTGRIVAPLQHYDPNHVHLDPSDAITLEASPIVHRALATRGLVPPRGILITVPSGCVPTTPGSRPNVAEGGVSNRRSDLCRVVALLLAAIVLTNDRTTSPAALPPFRVAVVLGTMMLGGTVVETSRFPVSGARHPRRLDATHRMLDQGALSILLFRLAGLYSSNPPRPRLLKHLVA